MQSALKQWLDRAGLWIAIRLLSRFEYTVLTFGLKEDKWQSLPEIDLWVKEKMTRVQGLTHALEQLVEKGLAEQREVAGEELWRRKPGLSL